MASSGYGYGNNGTMERNDDIEFLADNGIPAWSSQPLWSQQFKDYLAGLRMQNPQNIVSLLSTPPVKLANKRPNGSYSFITAEDVNQVELEVERTRKSWPSENQQEVLVNHTLALELHNLHNLMYGQIIMMKERCVRAYKRALVESFNNEGQHGSQVEQVLQTLHWQYIAYTELYRHTKGVLEEDDRRKPKPGSRKRK
ncbi:unnamed protein product [Orchesella dallaii]|uniref:Uncharacterized protein n=1 Tax=Orchesella dallaii TaxID=48710 RepID=A0ABP1R974_9HEXA